MEFLGDVKVCGDKKMRIQDEASDEMYHRKPLRYRAEYRAEYR